MKGYVRIEGILLAQSPSRQFPPCIPFPSNPIPPNPYPREGGSGARERKRKPKKSRQRERARSAEQEKPRPECGYVGWGVSRDQREEIKEQREGLTVFGEIKKENRPERTMEQKQNGLSKKKDGASSVRSSPMASHCLPDKVQTP